jgi:hypothetical protein
MDGRQVATAKAIENNKIQLPDLSAGMYLLQGQTESAVVRTRIFVSEGSK